MPTIRLTLPTMVLGVCLCLLGALLLLPPSSRGGVVEEEFEQVEGEAAPEEVGVAVLPRSAFFVHDLTTMEEVPDGHRVRLEGFYGPNDGGGGVFRYDERSTMSHDGGTVIAMNAPDPEEGLEAYLGYDPRSPGRWVREGAGQTLNVRWFGARGDGEQDDGPAVAAAIAAVQASQRPGEVYLPAGVYYVPGTVQLRPGVNMRGAGMQLTRIERRDSGNYLLRSGGRGQFDVTVSQLTLVNETRTVGLQNVSHVRFERVGFVGGIVRFEGSRFMRIENCTFRDNLGKAAYASDNCAYVTLANNFVHNAEQGGFNLSRHQHSVVANNTIVRDEIDEDVDGYGGIRLPNNARYNTVTGNVIQNHPRGIFVLTGSMHNTITGNVVRGARLQGVLVQADRNTFANNVIVDARDELFRLDNANANIVTGNQLTGSSENRAALSVTSQSADNRLTGNIIDAPMTLTALGLQRERNTITDNPNLREPPTASP